MKPGPLPLVVGLTLIVFISAASSFLTLRIVSNSPSFKAEDYHDWIHKKLKMSPEQEQLSQISERRYEETKRHLEEVIQLANRELAEKILKDKSYSPSVENPSLKFTMRWANFRKQPSSTSSNCGTS
jgi:hypothetical protein